MRLTLLILFFTFTSSKALKAETKFFIGSSAFMLANLDTTDEHPPHFYQLNFGIKPSPNHSLSLEFITWRYYAPLGIPQSKKGNREHDFNGHVRAKGFGLAYQYFITQNFYTAIHAQWMDQDYFNDQNRKLSSGKQLFLTYRLGYQFRFFKDSFFLEPNLAVTHWPTNTNLPADFQEKEDKWNNYFVFEPGLHFGFYF